MNHTPRLRRSALYTPGSNPRALEKTRRLPADVLIFDLEDSVTPGAKTNARDNVIAAAARAVCGFQERVIRVNGLDTPWGRDDLAAVAGCGIDAVLLPKVDTPADVSQAVAVLEQSGAPATLRVWIMAETPRAVLKADAIAASHPRLEVMVMGTADLAKALRIAPDRDRIGLIPALSRCVLAARACGLDILDGIDAGLDDRAGLERVCRQGKALGFDGKTLIHPRQIDTANSVFGISGEELDRARRILAAWEAAAAANEGIAVLEGHMIEQLHADAARRCIELAALIRRRSTFPDPHHDHT